MNERKQAVQVALNRLDEAQAKLDALNLTVRTRVRGVPLFVEMTDQEANQRWQSALAYRDKAFRAVQVISYLAHRGLKGAHPCLEQSE